MTKTPYRDWPLIENKHFWVNLARIEQSSCCFLLLLIGTILLHGLTIEIMYKTGLSCLYPLIYENFSKIYNATFSSLEICISNTSTGIAILSSEFVTYMYQSILTKSHAYVFTGLEVTWVFIRKYGSKWPRNGKIMGRGEYKNILSKKLKQIR